MTDDAGMLPPGPDGPVVDAALTRSVQALREFLARPGYAFSTAETLANLRAIHAHLATAQATYLKLVAELDRRPEALPHVAPGKTAATFLREALHISGPQANRDLRAAQAIASTTPELPAMGQALAEGTVSRDHLDTATSTIRRIPKHLKTKLIPTDQDADDGGDAGEHGGAADTFRTGAQVIDELLTEQSQHLSPSTVEILGRQILDRLDPDRQDRYDEDAHERRSHTWRRDFAGMGHHQLILDPASDALVNAALATHSAPTPAGTAVDEHGRQITVPDQRTATQRRADALLALLLASAGTHPTTNTDDPDDDETDETDGTGGLDETDEADTADGCGQAPGEASDPANEGGGEPVAPDPGRGLPPGVFAAKPCPGVSVTVVATIDQLAAAYGATDPAALQAGLARLSLAGPIGSYSGATLAPEVLARLTCDSPIRRILINPHGAVLHHGRAKRFATDPQKRALAIRENDCVIPGCHCPPEWCEAHHAQPWKDGGNTNIDEMVLLCVRHHTAHHADVYVIEMRDGIPWVRIPAWQDPTRPWLRNTTHQDHHRTADHLARRLTHQPPLLWQQEQPPDAA